MTDDAQTWKTIEVELLGFFQCLLTLYVINNLADRLAVEPDESDGLAELDGHADSGHQQVCCWEIHEEYVGYTGTIRSYDIVWVLEHFSYSAVLTNFVFPDHLNS